MQVNLQGVSIRSLFELFLQEFQTFGLCLALRMPPDNSPVKKLEKAYDICTGLQEPVSTSVNEYVKNRCNFINFLFESAELYYGLTVDNEFRPILYNRARWPKDAPLAGYGGVDSGVKYSQVLSTYVGNWINESENRQRNNSRLFLAAFWIWNEQGFEKAMQYILDLQKYGYVTKGLEDIMEVLIRSYGLGISIHEILERCFSGSVPSSNAEWLERRNLFSIEWALLDQSSIPLDITKIQSLLNSLVLGMLKDIEDARRLTDPVLWFLSQAAIGLRGELIINLFNRLNLTPAIAMKSILSQFEEIRADVLGQLYWYCQGCLKNFTPYHSPLAQMSTVLHVFRYRFAEEGERRVYKDRLIYPAVLREQAQQIINMDMPSQSTIVSLLGEWGLVSPYIIQPFAKGLGNTPSLMTLRAEGFPLEQMQAVPEIASFLEQHKIITQEERTEILKQVYMRELPSKEEERIKFLKQVYMRELPDTSLSKEYPIPLLSEEHRHKLVEILEMVHQSLANNELLTEIKALEVEVHEQKKNILEKLQALYPWSSAVYHELCVFHDQEGDHLLAWKYALIALVLWPQNHMIWQSLSVILRRTGNEADIRFVQGMTNFLKERKGN